MSTKPMLSSWRFTSSAWRCVCIDALPFSYSKAFAMSVEEINKAKTIDTDLMVDFI